LIELFVNTRGQVTQVLLIRSSGQSSLDAAALRLGRAYRFAPVAGPRRVRLPVTFELLGRAWRRS